jgi:fucose 4-O-acetylase-like acetyltransferase
MTTTDVVATRPSVTGAGHTSSAPAHGVGASARLFFADHMRVALTALVVIHHLTLAFVIPLPGSWYYEIPTANAAANLVGLLVVLIDQAFFMGAFFLLAGYFTPSAYGRKGAGGFLLERLVRLIIPLLAFDLVLGPVAEIPGLVMAYGHLSWSRYLETINPGPLWFVEVLFLLGCAYVAARLLLRRAAPEASPAQATPPTALAVFSFTLALAAVTFAFRLIVPLGYTLPILNLPTPAYLPQYVGLFAVGLVAARRDWLRSIPDWMGWTGLAISAVATVVLFLPALALGGKSVSWVGGMHWQAAAYALWDSTLAVGMFLGMLVIFRRWANRAGALWSELSRNQYAVYVLHAPLVVGLTVVLVGVPMHPLLRLLLAIAIGLPLCFTVAGLVRRIPAVDRVL